MKLIGLEGSGYKDFAPVKVGAAVLLRKDGKIMNGYTRGVSHRGLNRDEEEAIEMLPLQWDVPDNTAYVVSMSNYLLEYFPLKEIVDGLGLPTFYGEDDLIVTFNHELRDRNKEFSHSLGKVLIDNLHEGPKWAELVEPISYINTRSPYTWACKVLLDPKRDRMRPYMVLEEDQPTFDEALKKLEVNRDEYRKKNTVA